jgi:2-polyprenyl-3-methyl-5-hydroxy-6-metoxy-1,4-benzoquinol methylase
VYYTHESVVPGEATPGSRLGAWRKALRHGYLNRRFGLDLQNPSRLGPLVVPMIPGLARRQRQWARLSRPHRGATLLDVGAGSGGAVAHFRRLGWNATGIDVDPAAAEAARAAGIPVTCGEITSLAGADRFDAVTLNHSIEHLHEPTAALRGALRLLRPGGVIEVTTPNVGSIGSRMFTRDWLGLDPPRHLILFTTHGLTHALSEAGFRSVTFHRPQRRADWYFRASEALRTDRAWTATVGLGARARIGLVASDYSARFLFRCAEELVATAEKPRGA